MSLHKAILHGKEHRRPARGGKAVDGSCKNHGSCPFCRANRTAANRRRLAAKPLADE